MKKLLILLAFIPTLTFAQQTIPQGGTGWATSTKGDLLIGTTSLQRYTRLPIGTTNQILSITSGQPVWVATSSIFPSLSGYVPYTGATSDVNLGTHNLLFTNSTSTTIATTGYGLFGNTGGVYNSSAGSGVGGIGFNSVPDGSYIAGVAGFGALFQLAPSTGVFTMFTESNVSAGVAHSHITTMSWDSTGLVTIPKASSTALTATTLYSTTHIGSSETLSSTLGITGKTTFTNASGTSLTSTTFYSTNIYPSGLTGSWLATDLTGKMVATTTFPAPTLSGGINGFLARWTSSSALSTGLFRDDGTNSGVNATTSTSTLYIQGNTGTSNIISVASSTGGNPYFSVGSAGTTTARDLTSTNATSTILNVGSNLSINGTQVFNSTRDLTNVNTYTGGTINGQTISNTASFTGSVAVTTNVNASGTLGVTGRTDFYSNTTVNNANFGISTTTPLASITVATGSIFVPAFVMSTSTSMKIDMATSSNTLVVPIGVSGITFTFVNVYAGAQKMIQVINPPSGTPGTITWSGVTWSGGTSPTGTATNGRYDWYSCKVGTSTSSPYTGTSIGCTQTANFGQ